MAIVVHLYHVKTPFPIVSVDVRNGKSTGYDVMKTWGRYFFHFVSSLGCSGCKLLYMGVCICLNINKL